MQLADGCAPDDVGRLLELLPDWFGMPEANAAYVAAARRAPIVAARDADGQVLGVAMYKRHFPESAEIHLMAVEPGQHRMGIGRALLGAVEYRVAGARLLFVKTLGPSDPDVHYERTRAFYRACGFLPLEELAGLWPGNPCLILVKPLEARE